MSETTSNNIFGWTDFYHLYDKMVDKYDNTIFCEIGCFKGKSTVYLAQKIKEKKKNIKVVAVDLWPSPKEIEKYKETGAGQGMEGDIINAQGESLMQEFIDNLNHYNVRDIVYPIRAFSWDAATIFPDNYFSFVFVDAGHSYEQVYKDMEIWYKKLKDDAIFAGHDYFDNVYRAVNDFFADKKENNKEVDRICETCWYWEK